MKEERLEILKMLSEGKLNVDEAERLLDKLGGKERAPREKGEGFSFEVKQNLEGLGDFLREVGSTVSSAVSEALGTPSSQSPEDLGYKELDKEEDGSFSLQDGDELVLEVDRGGFSDKGGEIRVKITKKERARVESDGRVKLWQMKKGEERKVLILWEDGDIDLEIPEGLLLSGLELKTSGGDILGSPPNTKSALLAHTMGGNIRLHGIQAAFRVKTMGGDIELSSLCPQRGSSSAKTMGGNVKLSLSKKSSVVINALTMAGDIEIEETLGDTQHELGYVRQKASLTMNEGSAKVEATTMGGSIIVEKDVSSSEEVSQQVS